MNINTHLLKIGIVLLATICSLILTHYSFQHKEENIQLKIKQALQESITKDYNQRLLKGSIHTGTPLERKVKRLQILTENGSETFTFKDSIDEQIANQLADQYAMALFVPIIPNDFNAIFKEELAKCGITNKTGIIYRYKNKKQYSDNDSISPNSALLTRIKMLDIKNTVSVQAWVEYDWKTLLRHTNSKDIWVIISCYIASLIVIFYERKKKKSVEPVKENNENLYKVADIQLDLKEKRLYINEIECSICNMDFDLLHMFLKSPNYFLTREEIRQTLWPKEYQSEDRINSHITALRKILKEFPEYELITDRGKGYHLSIP